MTQYTGQITVIVEAENAATAESRLRAIASHIEEEADEVVFADHNGDVENYEALEAECQKSLESGPAVPARFDGYEIQPCRRYIDADEPSLSFVEPCEAFEADFWTLCGHVTGEGVYAIGDFHDRKHAEEIYARITGLNCSGSSKTDTNQRVMQAGPKLLQALIAASDWINAQTGTRRTEIQLTVQDAIFTATGRAA